MKIFLDTADIESIKKWKSTGLIDGVTTNPAHLSKAGGNPAEVVKEICQLLPEGDISVEVTEHKPDEVYAQAQKIAAIAPNVVVKIPVHSKYLSVIKQLVDEGIRINITLLFSVVQALMMAKLGVEYISPFIGRIDDIDGEGLKMLEDTVDLIDLYEFDTQVLAASLRSVRYISDVIRAGADAITIPVDIFEKALDHPLTRDGMEKFDKDWQKLGVRKFP